MFDTVSKPVLLWHGSAAVTCDTVVEGVALEHANTEWACLEITTPLPVLMSIQETMVYIDMHWQFYGGRLFQLCMGCTMEYAACGDCCNNNK